MVDTKASAVTGPTPGTLINKWQAGLTLARVTTSLSSSSRQDDTAARAPSHRGDHNTEPWMLIQDR